MHTQKYPKKIEVEELLKPHKYQDEEKSKERTIHIANIVPCVPEQVKSLEKDLCSLFIKHGLMIVRIAGRDRHYGPFKMSNGHHEKRRMWYYHVEFANSRMAKIAKELLNGRLFHDIPLHLKSTRHSPGHYQKIKPVMRNALIQFKKNQLKRRNLEIQHVMSDLSP